MIKFLNYINPYQKLWKLFLVNFIIAVVVLFLFWNDSLSSIKEFSISFIWAYTICITQWAGHVYINNKLSERFSWADNPIKRTLLGILFVVGYGVFAYLIVQFIMFRLVYGDYPPNPFNWAMRSSIYVIIISSVVTLIFTAIGFFKAWKRSLLEAEKFKTQMLAYKYEALQNQINPHFLFNSFNVLSDLVYEDQKKAVYFIKKLSHLFRYVLDSREKELTPLAEELEFIKTFVFLLQMRFDEKLNVKIDLPTKGEELIVPMAMQILVENCVKHNEVSSEKPLTIEIFKHDDTLIIKNNLQIKNVGTDSKGTGLNNIKQQYSFFTEREIEIENDGTYFSVRLPILKTTK